MAAPNAQPSGSRPGPLSPHTHAPHKAGKPAGEHSHGNSKGSGLPKHGAPKGVGANKKSNLK